MCLVSSGLHPLYFPSADFDLYAFDIIGYDYMLSPVSPPSDSLGGRGPDSGVGPYYDLSFKGEEADS